MLILLPAVPITALPTSVCGQQYPGQQYPTKAIRLIVPLAPGGGNDTIARMIGQKIQGPLGQSVVIENRAGAGGQIGAEVAAKAPPDGYTLLLGNAATQSIIPNVRDSPLTSPGSSRALRKW